MAQVQKIVILCEKKTSFVKVLSVPKGHRTAVTVSVLLRSHYLSQCVWQYNIKIGPGGLTPRVF